jgi:hypothetical protein
MRFWMEGFVSGAFAETEPQMNTDERRFVAPGMCGNGRGADLMRLAAQDFSISTTAENAKVAKINGFVL